MFAFERSFSSTSPGHLLGQLVLSLQQFPSRFSNLLRFRHPPSAHLDSSLFRLLLWLWYAFIARFVRENWEGNHTYTHTHTYIYKKGDLLLTNRAKNSMAFPFWLLQLCISATKKCHGTQKGTGRNSSGRYSINSDLNDEII